MDFLVKWYDGTPFSTKYTLESVIAKAGIIPPNAEPTADEQAALGQYNDQRSRQSLAVTDDVSGAGTSYRRLADPQHIRVAELHAGSYDDDLQCTLRTCSLEFKYPHETRSTYHAVSIETGQPVWYTALSYVWGQPRLDSKITCNGHTKYITTKLNLALRRFRHWNDNIVLWIDQLCINQEDEREKSQQVMLMGAIFQRAWNTIIWLGDQGDDECRALDIIREICLVLDHFPDGLAVGPADLERLGLPAVGSSKWKEVQHFFTHTWFTRVWTIQEAAVSENLHVASECDIITWSDMAAFSSHVKNNDLLQYIDQGLDGQAHKNGCIRLSDVEALRHTSFSLLHNLEIGRSANATVLRDKVYAFLGLSQSGLVPDYSKSVSDSEIFLQTARTIFPRSPVELLCSVDHLETQPGMPSWVPDWALARETTSLGYHEYRTFSSHIYLAGQPTHRPELRNPQIGFDQRTLRFSAKLFDTIRDLGPVFYEPDLKEIVSNGSETKSVILDYLRLSMECQPYPSGSELFDAFWHTLVAGKNETGVNEAPADFANVFSLLLDEATGRSPSMSGQTYPKRQLTLEHLERRKPAKLFRNIQVAFANATRARRFGVTEKKYIGLFPRGSRHGDLICVPPESHIPFVIRESSGGQGYVLIGECYVDGIMKGEVFQLVKTSAQEIVLH